MNENIKEVGKAIWAKAGKVLGVAAVLAVGFIAAMALAPKGEEDVTENVEVIEF